MKYAAYLIRETRRSEISDTEVLSSPNPGEHISVCGGLAALRVKIHCVRDYMILFTPEHTFIYMEMNASLAFRYHRLICYICLQRCGVNMFICSTNTCHFSIEVYVKSKFM